MGIPTNDRFEGGAYDPEAAREDLEAVLAELTSASREWGLKPNEPEARLIGAHFNAQRIHSRLIVGSAKHMEDIIHELKCQIGNAKFLAEGDLARQRVITSENALAFGKLTTMLSEAASNVKIAQEGLAEQMVKKVFPDAVRALSGALVIHEQRVSHSIEWGRHFTLAAIAIGLVFGGYVWGTWADWGMATRLEDFRFAIDRCAFSTPALTIPGVGKVCRLDSMVRTGDLALGQ